MGEALEGATILIVEDEAIIALDMKATLLDAGAGVAGPVRNVAEALDIISRMKLSAGVLDVRLGTDAVWPVAEALVEKGVPFVFHTAHGEKDLKNPAWTGRPVIQKPATARQLVNAIVSLLKN